MTTARTHTATLTGVTGHLIRVQADITNGPAGMIVTGLPDTMLREARDRIRAAIVNSGHDWPHRQITVSLTPASMPKPGGASDLAIAVAILAATGNVPASRATGVMFQAELGLDGRLRPVRGVLPAVIAAAREEFGAVLVAAGNATEARLVPGIEVVPATTLADAVHWLRGSPGRPPLR